MLNLCKSFLAHNLIKWSSCLNYFFQSLNYLTNCSKWLVFLAFWKEPHFFLKVYENFICLLCHRSVRVFDLSTHIHVGKKEGQNENKFHLQSSLIANSFPLIYTYFLHDFKILCLQGFSSAILPLCGNT